MADKRFRIVDVSDGDALKQLEAFCRDVGIAGKMRLTFNLGPGIEPIANVPFDGIEQNATLKMIKEANGHSWQKISVAMKGGQDGSLASITFSRDTDGQQEIILETGGRGAWPQDEAARCYLAAEKCFQVYDPIQRLDRALGPELAEFYRKREQGVVRLEELTQRLIAGNEDYRRELDRRYLDKETKLENEYGERLAALKKKEEERDAEMKEKQTELETRAKHLDDRDSKHSRRALRQEIKQQLEERSKEFKLTRATSRKRAPIHGLFIGMITVIVPDIVKYNETVPFGN